MIFTNTDFITGKKVVRTLGVVRGNTNRVRHLGKDILAVLKNIVGGEIEEYTKLFAETRDQVIDRMIANAKEFGANAIINVRFSTSYVMQNASEILAYGTAVVVEGEMSK